MNDSSDPKKMREDVAIHYFRLVDAADHAVLDLLSGDARMFLPKSGLAAGKDQTGAFVQGLGRGISKIERDIPGFTVPPSRNHVVIEGAVKGTTASGVDFPDRVSSFGLFRVARGESVRNSM
ncbi:hypothetical protein ABT215_06545 [Streptomyces sp900105755]|uniref:hypothetical protein n=1 Tax=Streptomyces sp. 900105755 TaxID=3154389 RepID=UPI00331F9FC3